MSNIKTIVVNNVNYDIEDANARLSIAEIQENVPKKLSDLTSDATHRTVTDEDKTNWNNKSDFSGSYDDLINKPSIPSIEGLATETEVAKKVDKVAGKSLISDAEIIRLSNVNNYDDTAITGRVTALENAGYITADAIKNKADKSTTLAGYGITNAYTKGDVDTELAKKETAGAAATAESNANSYTDQKISSLINGAPETLDTLKEIADAMTEHKEVVNVLEEAIGKKADKATTLAGYGITDAATSTQGGKADSAVQSVKIGTTEYKSGTTVTLPDYPTTLPASDTTSTYSATGTAPVNGKAVASAISGKADSSAIPTESTVSGWGFTKNVGTVTGINMNGSSVGTSGVVDLGTVVTKHQSNLNLGQGYGTCSTAESTTAKVVSLSNYVLANGGIISIKFTNAVPANATLNVNNKGAKNIFFNGAAITAGIIKAGYIATFMYDGTQYQLIAIDHATGSSSSPTGKIDLVLNNSEPTNYTPGMIWIDASNTNIEVYEFKYQSAEPTGVSVGCGWVG